MKEPARRYDAISVCIVFLQVCSAHRYRNRMSVGHDDEGVRIARVRLCPCALVASIDERWADSN
jgi:hypothetical protein